LKDIFAHEKNCTNQAFFCPNKGCYQRIPALKLDNHLKKCHYELIPCNSCGFEILRKEDGEHDCVTRMMQHIEKVNAKNEEVSNGLKSLNTQEHDIKNRLDYMTTENNNETMKLIQQCEHLERENGSALHDISSIPTGTPTKTRQEELEELNEFDNVTDKSVTKYIRKVDKRVTQHTDEISEAYEAMQERLRGHFRVLADSVRDKFEREVIHLGINQEFEKLSPIKTRDEYDDDYAETGEDSRLSGIQSSDEKLHNDECLPLDLKQMKTILVKAYTNPLEEYQCSINTTAEFGKNARLQKDIKYMSMKQRHDRFERSGSVEHREKRENMKNRLKTSRMATSVHAIEKSQANMVKSARLWNAFDNCESYPDQKFTDNVSSRHPSHSQKTKQTMHKSKTSSVYVENNVRRKKDELVKTLLFSNRNR
jgi:hypothetical protein